MKRRELLSGLGLTTAGIVVGYQTGVLRRPKNPELSLASKRAESVKNIRVSYDMNSVRCDNVATPPRIEFDNDSKKASVTGCIYVGPDDCKRPGIQNFEEKEAGVVEIVISAVKLDGLDGACDASIASNTYKVEVYFEKIDNLKLKAIEEGSRGTVNSSSQVLK